ncbi:hypothetical protein PV08_10059 [Exophiala spinifera]|uniref:Glycolipid transfer protein domain-containing protein n=1 Tax=Exophiala spinifera TaxID=91928 RepID=A0A0D2AW84_9EURO|nr:uncharacterized protein PV08_10059 [Exophiala spinifera]KIW10760.1 hypothetical protein PV08_10059 [Exophiala spinifera]
MAPRIAIPPGETWFDMHNTDFPDVSVSADGEVSTTEFLSATEATTTIFDMLGSAVFTPIKNDMLFNVGRVRSRQAQDPRSSEMLQGLVKNELATRAHSATAGLTWLVRGLDFLSHALRTDLTQNNGISATEKFPKIDLRESFRDSYKVTLSPYHTAMIRPIFRAAMGASPRRKDLYIRLSGKGTDPEMAVQAMEKWVIAVETIVTILKDFLASDEVKASLPESIQ